MKALLTALCVICGFCFGLVLSSVIWTLIHSLAALIILVIVIGCLVFVGSLL